MWWLIPIGLGLAAAAIIKALDDEAGSERKRWNQHYQEVQRDIEWHRNNIEKHLGEAQASYDFHVLTDLHFSSMKVADEAYKLLNGGHMSISAISKAIVTAKEQIAHLTERRRSSTDSQERQAIVGEIDGLRKLRKTLFDDKDALTNQKNGFLSEVKRLNNQTRMLKENIRDRTGIRGAEWYQRTEARKASKRASGV